jgi:hypothetical protein
VTKSQADFYRREEKKGERIPRNDDRADGGTDMTKDGQQAVFRVSVEKLRAKDEEISALHKILEEMQNELATARNRLAMVQENTLRLQQIAAHVPAAVWLKAKEDAELGEAIRPKAGGLGNKDAMSKDGSLEDCLLKCAADSGSLDGLRYALSIVKGRRVLNRPVAYLVALDDIEIFLNAAIERVENGEPMYSTATVQ